MNLNEISVLHLGLSYVCNLRCAHCFSCKDQDLLAEKDFIQIIDQLYDLGLFMVYYTYGEPLLAKAFWSVVSHCKRKGLVQILMSNGMMINKSVAKQIKSSGINKVFISLDHHIPEKHDENRGVNGAYAKAIHAVKHLQDNHLPVGMAVTVTEKNAEAIWDIYRLCDDLQIQNISFLRQRDYNRLASFSPKALNAYETFFVAVVEKGMDGIMFHDCSLNSKLSELLSAGRINQCQYEKFLLMNQCHTQNTICIEPNGDVSRCNLCKHCIGNITRRSSISELLQKGCQKGGCCPYGG